MKRIPNKGFSTLELMIAFALMSIIFTGVILAHFGSAYWAVAAQTSNEGLYKAKTRLEELRAIVKKDFRMASSSATAKVLDASCVTGGLCYYVTTDVADLSPCSKYVTAAVEWRVQGYPTTTTSLFTNLTDTNEAIQLGGDCPLIAPAGAWGSATQAGQFDTAGGTLLGVDVLGSMVYAVSNQSPYLFIASTSAGFITFDNGFTATEPLNAIDVARDLTTGRTYGFAAVASTTIGLEVLDLTDPYNPASVATLALPGVDKNGGNPQGWRIAYYDRKVYLTTRYTAGPEFHVIDVSSPSNPISLGSYNLETSPYGIVVRDIKQGNALRRVAFLATTEDQKELMVLNVTNPASIAEMGATTDLTGSADGYSVFFAGNTVYLGREANPSGPELYALDASNIFTASTGLPIVGSAREVGGTILGIRVSAPYVFAAVQKSTSQFQVFNTTNGVLSATPTTFNTAGLSGGIDMEGKSIYVAGSNAPRLRIIQSQ